MKMNQHNISVSQTFNEFAEQTNNIDYETEDLVSLCIESTSVFYWLNIESVWGPVGFQWDVYEEKGHFNTNPVKFDILPRVPDPHRLKSFYNLFSNFRSSSKQMTILHNKWDNIDTLGDWNHPDVVINVSPDNKFTKIANSTSVGEVGDKITIVGGDYSKIEDIGNRLIAYTGTPLNFNLLSLYKDHPEYSYNKYNCLRVSLDTEVESLTASDYINTEEDNWVIDTGDSPYVPSIVPKSLNSVKVDTDLRPVVVNGNKIWHTLFLGIESAKSIHVRNPLSSKQTSLTKEDTSDMYMLFTGDPVKFIVGETFTYEGDEFNPPIYRSNTTITLDELESIPDEYNMFIHSDTKCKYWKRLTTVTNNSSNVTILGASASASLVDGVWLYKTAVTDINKAISLDIDTYLLNKFGSNQCALSMDYPTISTDSPYYIDTNSMTVSQFTEKVKELSSSTGFVKAKIGELSIDILLDDIRYTQSEVGNSTYLFRYDGSNNKGRVFLNDSIDTIEKVAIDGVLVLNRNMTASAPYLALLSNSPYRLTIREGATANGITGIYFNGNTLNEFLAIPELRTPINDPDNYEYNHSIVDQYFFHLHDGKYRNTRGITENIIINRQPYFLSIKGTAYPPKQYPLIMANNIVNGGNSIKSVISSLGQSLVELRNTDLLAVDYPPSVDFHYQPWFVDEESGDLTTLKKEKANEFYNKIMLNPANKGKKDLSILTFSSEQYKLFDKEQIDTLIEYGYSIKEVL